MTLVDAYVNSVSSQEFAKKIAAKNHFLCSVLEKDKPFVAGAADDLERIAG